MFVESLEGRALMSASALSTQVTIDRLQTRADLLKFRSDVAAGTAKLLADVAALKADGLGSNPTFVSLFGKLHSDVKSMWEQLKLDRLNESASVLHDQSVYVQGLIQFLKDKGNPAARAGDQQQLIADRVQLQNDEIAGLTARIDTREADCATISTDIQNIITAADALSPSGPLQGALLQFAADRTSVLNTITTDLQTLVTDRTNLADALSALLT
jgi:hypothetical protein